MSQTIIFSVSEFGGKESVALAELLLSSEVFGGVIVYAETVSSVGTYAVGESPLSTSQIFT